ncbi:MarR family transcriptional regulator [Amycolatopsis sp. PS_44_ISF1]|uniref:MarR family winged helix-turn-helix transcriptional regulator n=1 Tax=Amycolatopsis sp. PS_44_ISF1 TaxID=2974917 RepID=UPI0028DE62E1|nr:MarR family transcriptional regulator [Amycolatopsis sp. PS_44_ISF1]MDT8913453.1 MarR family transcriptional regulator [Amycolatopsis sp. PS_44_ISF1]
MVTPPGRQGRLDYVDEMLEVTSAHYDEDHALAKALAYRVRRLAHRLETEIKRELTPHGIELWELELLACLLRTKPTPRLSAGALMAQLQLTSGAVTNRVTKMERNGWVTRDLDPDDRRSVLVTLTPAGEERAMEVFDVKSEAELTVLSALGPAAQRRLSDDLRTVLLSLEGER